MSVNNKSATLQKLYNCPKEAREQLHKLLSQASVKNGCILVMFVVPTLQRLSQLPYLKPHAAAAT